MIDPIDWDRVAIGRRFAIKAHEVLMIIKPDSVLKSKKAAGFLWLLAGLLMIIPPIFLDGNKTYIAIGAMFLIFGIVFLGRDRKI